MTDWMDVMLGEIERKRHEQREAEEEAARRRPSSRDESADGAEADPPQEK